MVLSHKLVWTCVEDCLRLLSVATWTLGESPQVICNFVDGHIPAAAGLSLWKTLKVKTGKRQEKHGKTQWFFWSTDPILENSRVELSNDEQMTKWRREPWTVNGTVRHGWPKPRTAPRWPSGCSSSARASAANALEIEIEKQRDVRILRIKSLFFDT